MDYVHDTAVDQQCCTILTCMLRKLTKTRGFKASFQLDCSDDPQTERAKVTNFENMNLGPALFPHTLPIRWLHAALSLVLSLRVLWLGLIQWQCTVIDKCQVAYRIWSHLLPARRLWRTQRHCCGLHHSALHQFSSGAWTCAPAESPSVHRHLPGC